MNKRNFKGLPPRPFPKKQYMKLGHKIGLCFILPIFIILLGGGIGTTCYYHQHQIHHHTYRVVHQHKHVAKPANLSKHVNHQPKLKAINVTQGEHLLGRWLRQLHYPTAKAQAVLTDYQKQNKDQDFKISQELNQLTHGSMSNQTRIRRIHQVINKI